MTENAHRTIDAVWRIEQPKLIASLTRMVRDVGLAEELAQDALVAALEKWPASGVPDNPGAWLMATARNRAIDRLRRDRNAPQPSLEEDVVMPVEPEEVGDDLLRLMLISCHPVLSRDARVALTLRLLGGLSVPEIARAFLTPEATIQQRIVRAKKA